MRTCTGCVRVCVCVCENTDAAVDDGFPRLNASKCYELRLDLVTQYGGADGGRVDTARHGHIERALQYGRQILSWPGAVSNFDGLRPMPFDIQQRYSATRSCVCPSVCQSADWTLVPMIIANLGTTSRAHVRAGRTVQSAALV